MPFIPAFYGKLDKAASDLLKADDFDLNRKVSVASKSEAGVTFTSSATAAKESVTGNLKAEFKDKKVGELTAEVDTVQLISGTWKTPEVLTKGLKLEVKAKHDFVKEKRDCFVSVEDLYSRENLAASVLFKVANAKEEGKALAYSLAGSAVLGKNGISVGGEVEYDFAKLTKSDLAAAYSKNNLTIVAKSAKALSEASLAYHHEVLPKTSVAAVAKYTFKSAEKGLTFGIKQGVTDGSDIRATLSTDSKATKISALYSALLNPHSKLSLSSVIDVKQLSGGDHKFGIKLEVGDL